MADAHVGVTDVSGGRQIDVSETTVGGVTVDRQRIVIADDVTAAGLARVRNGAPGAADYGQVVRTPPRTWATPARAAQATGDTSLAGANANRRGLVIINAAAAVLYVRLDGTAVSLTAGAEVYTYALQPNATLELADGEAGVAGVRGVWAASGTGYAMVSEAT